MNRRLLVPLAVLLVAAAAAFFWWRSAGGEAEKPAAAAAATAAPASPTRYAGEDAEEAPAAPPEVVMDADPTGPLRLEGQVLDREDRAVAGAVVTLSSNPPRTTTSETDGSFYFDELIGKAYTLTARSGDEVGGPVVHRLTSSSDPAVIRVRPGARLRVSVLAASSDQPIAGATVQLRDGEVRTAVTGADGVAELRGVASGFFGVRAHAPGFAPALQAVQVPDNPGAEVTVRVLLSTGAAVAGRVVDPDGKPIQGARVTASDVSAAFSMVDPRHDGAVTDASGRFRLDAVAAGTYRFAAVHDDHAPAATEPINVDGSSARDDLEIVMAPGGVVAGRVVTSAGQPAPWTTVRIGSTRPVGPMSGGNLRGTTSDADGTFELRGLPRMALEAVAIGAEASSETAPVDLAATPAIDDLELVLSLEDAIAGIVVDAEGKPVTEVQVSAFPDFFSGGPTEDFALRGMSSATTDGAGRFAVKGLPKGTYRLRPMRAASWSAFMQRGTQASTGDTDVKLVLAAGGGLAGTVQYEGGGAAELFTVTVGFPPGVPVSDQAGRFALEDIPPGTYDVTIRGPGFARVVRRDIAIESGQQADLGTVTVQRGRSVTGRVLGPDGAPVAGAEVVVARQLFGDGRSMVAGFGEGAEEMWGVRRGRSEADGSFAIPGIGKTEELVIAAEHSEIGRSDPQPIVPGRESAAIELALRAFGSVSGTVTAGGEPAAGVGVIANGKTGAQQNIMVQTGEDGRYVIDKLPEGTFKLTAAMGGMGSQKTGTAEVAVKAGQRATGDIEIPIGDVHLMVEVEGEGDVPISTAQVLLMEGEVPSGNAKQLQEFIMGNGGGGAANVALALSGKPASFEKVVPGPYSVCVIPLPGDLSDPTTMQRLQEHPEKIATHCRMETIAPSPREQTLTMVVPPPEPIEAE